MRLRSARSARFPWNSVLLFLVGVAVGAVLMALAFAPPAEPGGVAEDSSPGEPPTLSSTAAAATPTEGTVVAVLSTTGPLDEQTKTPDDQQPVGAADTPVQPTAAQPTSPPTLPPSSPPPSEGTLTREQVETAVTDAVERFQEAKEKAQRTGDTSQLNQVLAGQALERQIDLVNATTAAGCYWEISLTEPLRVEFIELRGDDYAFVRVYKTETRRKYCDGTLDAVAENDSYSTTYVVERIGDAWYVTERE